MARPSKAKQRATESIGLPTNWQWTSGTDELFPLTNAPYLMQEMRTMWLTDETAGAMSWCISTCLARAQWQFIPQVDGVDAPKDKEAIRWAAWANTLFSDMDGSMEDHVEDALAMLWAGFAPCEVILKQRDGVDSRNSDGFYGIERLPLMDPRTVTSWVVDSRRRVIGMRQMGAKGALPLSKVCHYRVTSEMDNPWGRPLLLNARRAWLLKIKIQDSEAIGIERDLCGLPIMRIPQFIIDQSKDTDSGGVATEAAREAQSYIASARKAVSDMRFNKSGGLVMASDTWYDETNGDSTPMYDFKIMTTAGQRSIDTRTAARDYDRAIARLGMMQFLHLGDRATGSFALSDDQSSLAVQSFTAIGNKIGEEFTRKAVKLVWLVNNFPAKYMPRASMGAISKENMQQLGALLGGLGKIAGLIEGDADARSSVLETANISYNRETQEEMATTARKKSDTEAIAPKPTFGASASKRSDDNADD